MPTPQLDEWSVSLVDEQRAEEIAKAEAELASAERHGSPFSGAVSSTQACRMNKGQRQAMLGGMIGRFRAADRLEALRDPVAAQARINERAARQAEARVRALESNVRLMLSGPGLSGKTGKLLPSIRRSLLLQIDHTPGAGHLAELVLATK